MRMRRFFHLASLAGLALGLAQPALAANSLRAVSLDAPVTLVRGWC